MADGDHDVGQMLADLLKAASDAATSGSEQWKGYVPRLTDITRTFATDVQERVKPEPSPDERALIAATSMLMDRLTDVFATYAEGVLDSAPGSQAADRLARLSERLVKQGVDAVVGIDRVAATGRRSPRVIRFDRGDVGKGAKIITVENTQDGDQDVTFACECIHGVLEGVQFKFFPAGPDPFRLAPGRRRGIGVALSKEVKERPLDAAEERPLDAAEEGPLNAMFVLQITKEDVNTRKQMTEVTYLIVNSES